MVVARNSRGDGSVYLRKDGRYEVAIIGPDGKRYRDYARTKTEANQLRRAMRSRLDSGLPATDSSVALAKFLARWLDDTAPRRRRESTVREYRRRIEGYVIPVLGDRKLASITDSDVEDAMDSWRDEGLSRESIRAVKNALAAALTDAVRSRLIRRNPATSARLPDMPGTPKVRPVTAEEVGQLLAEAKGSEIEPLVVLVAHTGCRIGEALGAKWGDIDLEAAHWVIRQTVTRTGTGGIRVGERNKAGDERLVALSSDACEVLRAQRKQVARMRLSAGRQWCDEDLVFPSSIGTPQDPNNVRSILRPTARRAGFPASFHALRHFMVSVAASSGTPIPVIAKLVGHKRVATTADLYAHLQNEDAVRVSYAVSSAVNSARDAALRRQTPTSEA